MNEGIGIVYTRTGRRFFDNSELERAFLTRIQSAISTAGFWDEFNTEWFCLDCELLPWSTKAQELLKQQYAAVGAAGKVSLADAVAVLESAAARGLEVDELLDRTSRRQVMLSEYVEAYRRYCWPVQSLDDLKLAPFHILASEVKAHSAQPHTWHMDTLAKLCAVESLLLKTPYKLVDVTNPERGGRHPVVERTHWALRRRHGRKASGVYC